VVSRKEMPYQQWFTSEYVVRKAGEDSDKQKFSTAQQCMTYADVHVLARAFLNK
jgi:hypothetical protein